MKKWLLNHREELQHALHQDMGKPATEAEIIELKPIIGELKDAIRNVHHWSKARRVGTPIYLVGGRSRIVPQPKGVSLILSPWNFPFLLTVGPMISAIAANCPVIVKPSEFTPHTSAFIQKMVEELFTAKEVKVLTGDATLAQQLTAMPFNHVFFTGSPAVGKLVMREASQHLTSVTLELGGCNPAIVDRSANIKQTAQRIIYGKLMNCGQSCISINTLYVHEDIAYRLQEELQKVLQDRYALNQEEGRWRDYGKIVSERHHGRLTTLLQQAVEAGGDVVHQGESHGTERYMEPTILRVKVGNPILEEEIFGPILPIVTYREPDEFLPFLRTNQKALVGYVFTKSNKVERFWRDRLETGMFSVNETTIFFANNELPFGGVGYSGIGKSHGKFGFDEFTHERTYFKQWSFFSATFVVLPPFKSWKQKMLRLMTRWF